MLLKVYAHDQVWETAKSQQRESFQKVKLHPLRLISVAKLQTEFLHQVDSSWHLNLRLTVKAKATLKKSFVKKSKAQHKQKSLFQKDT